jgi:hypothetical protein
MEVLELAGYTEEEKLKIAVEHLIAKQVTNHGLSPDHVEFTEAAIRAVIRGYTREAGVRNLEREVGALCRKIARRRAEGDETKVVITPEAVVEMLGAPTFLDEEIENRRKTQAWLWASPDASWRGRALRRGLADARRRQPDADRSSRGRHEGIRADRALLVPGECDAVRRGPGIL